MLKKINLKKSLIIIPARGGSKGIARKNIRPLAGYPFIYYSIQASKNINFKADIVVSTDDNEIGMVASYFGVDVHIREKRLAKDQITLDPVIISCTQYLEKKNNLTYDYMFTVQPTSPLILSKDINECIKNYLLKNLLTL